MSEQEITVTAEATPNPDSYKFIFNQKISDENVNFDDPVKSSRSPLANKIFGFPWVNSVFIGNNFVTINKQDWVDWDLIADPLSHLLKEHLEDKLPIFAEDIDTSKSEYSGAKHKIDETDSELVKKIKGFLDQEIRPFVAMDGGDVTFNNFNSETGLLQINMTGACDGCPSSTATLKMGIESRIQEIIPEVKEVTAG